MRRLAAGALVVVMTAAAAAAQEPPAGARAERPPSSLADPWRLYHQAFVVLAEGDRPRARRLLEELVAAGRGHPAAVEGNRRLAELERFIVVGPTAADPGRAPLDTPGDERPTKLARAELLFFQTVNGATMGLELCDAIRCDDSRFAAGMMILGAAAGFGLSLALTSDHGITPGHTHAIDSGAVWGLFHGLALAEHADAPGDGDDTTYAMIGQLVGTGVGELAWRAAKPTAGEVAVANTAGFWTGILALFAFGIADVEPEILTVTLAADAGLVAGALLARGRKVSRGRTYLIDAAGVIGMLAGLLVASGMDDDSTAFTSVFVGTSAGLATGVLVTRNWDE